VAINDPANWATITGSFAAPVVGASPPYQWQGGVAGPLNPHPVNDYLLFAPATGLAFAGITYIGAALVGTLQVNWTAEETGIFIPAVLTVRNALGATLASYTLQSTDTTGVLVIPVNAANNGGIEVFLNQGTLPPQAYGNVVSVTFAFLADTGAATGAAGSLTVPAAALGPNPALMLRWSDDGGYTWSNEHWAPIGAMGQFKNRAMFRCLGQARDRIYEVVISDAVPRDIVGATLYGESQ
jgi:hypothetical protein